MGRVDRAMCQFSQTLQLILPCLLGPVCYSPHKVPWLGQGWQRGTGRGDQPSENSKPPASPLFLSCEADVLELSHQDKLFPPQATCGFGQSPPQLVAGLRLSPPFPLGKSPTSSSNSGFTLGNTVLFLALRFPFSLLKGNSRGTAPEREGIASHPAWQLHH